MNEQEKYDWMVRVGCMTFNHAPYIVDAMNGFTMQQTDFSFVCTIIDDASTDGEQEVIKSYLNEHFDLEDKNVARHEETNDYVLTFARHKTNKNCYFAVFYLKYNHYSIKKSKAPYISQWRDNAKYFALCEGDDYWTDKGKLQKQVEFMEKKTDYSFCHTGFDWYYDEKGLVESGKDISEQNQNIVNTGENLRYAILDGNRYRIQTLTTVIRTSCYLQALNDLSQDRGKFLMGDTQLWLQLMSYGKVFFDPVVTGVYRVKNGSASHPVNIGSKIRFHLSSCEMRVTMAERFSLGIKELKQFYHEYYRMLAKYYLYNRDYQPFIEKKYCSFIDNIILVIAHNPITNRIIRKLYDIKNRQ